MTLANAIRALLSHNTKLGIVTTGAGLGIGGFLGDILGISQVLQFCEAPYAQSALEGIVGPKVTKFVSSEVAVALAQYAREKAKRLWEQEVAAGRSSSESMPNFVGLAVTGAIATDRERRGDDHFYVAVDTDDGASFVHITFARQEKFEIEQQSIRRAYQNAIAVHVAAALWLSTHSQHVKISLDGLNPDKSSVLASGVSDHGFLSPMSVRSVGKPASALHEPDGQILEPNTLDPARDILYPGSFNPIHEGHHAVIDAVKARTGKRVVCHIDTTHPVKDVNPADVERRVKTFEWRHPVLLTSGLGLFVEKARAFPGMEFVLGVDVFEQLLHSQHGYPSPLLEEFVSLGTHFHVVTRRQGGVLRGMSSVLSTIDGAYQTLFSEIVVDVEQSSTALRARGEGAVRSGT